MDNDGPPKLPEMDFGEQLEDEQLESSDSESGRLDDEHRDSSDSGVRRLDDEQRDSSDLGDGRLDDEQPDSSDSGDGRLDDEQSESIGSGGGQLDDKQPENGGLGSRQLPKALKKFTCQECGKSVTHLARHLIAVHNMDEIKARGVRYDRVQSKRKKVRCPKCDREVINLSRHLSEVEKVSPEVMKDLMDMVRKPKKAKKDGSDFKIPTKHPQKHLLEEYAEYRLELQRRSVSTVKKFMEKIR